MANLGEFTTVMGNIDKVRHQLTDWIKPLPVERSATSPEAEAIYVKYEPRGVVLLFGTWDFPFGMLFSPAAQPGGGFMSRMFGQNRDAAPMGAPQGRSGGGFLKTAAAAAAGVAGGALLFQGLNGVFGGHDAAASGAHHVMEEPDGWDEDDQW